MCWYHNQPHTLFLLILILTSQIRGLQQTKISHKNIKLVDLFKKNIAELSKLFITKQKNLMQITQTLLNTGIFRIPNQQQLQNNQLVQPLLSSFFQIMTNRGEIVLAKLFKKHLTIQFAQTTSNHFIQYILIADLNSRIKFDLLQNSQIQNSNKNLELLGFKLILNLIQSNQQQSIQFYGNSQVITQKWIQSLRNILNEHDFHSKFKPIRKIGKGNFANVYEVQKNQDKKKYAVKAFSKQNLRRQRNGIQSLQNQINILRQINHHNLLKIEGVFESDNSIYIVMQLLQGKNLYDMLEQKSYALNSQIIRSLMKGIMRGLSHLQQMNIVHRDLKLENIMLRNNSEQPVIVDFGLSIFSQDQNYIYPQCGTPGYISPEIVNYQVNQTIRPISDVFSAGIIFYILLTGSFLFKGKTTKQVLQSNKKFDIDLSNLSKTANNNQAINLLKKTLELDSNRRISASSSLKDPFFYGITQKCKNEDFFSTITEQENKQQMDIQPIE